MGGYVSKTALVIRLALLFLGLLYPTFSWSQNVLLRGTASQMPPVPSIVGVLHFLNKPMAGLKVVAKHEGIAIDSTITDPWGYFWLPLPAEGTYTIQAIEKRKFPNYGLHAETIQTSGVSEAPTQFIRPASERCIVLAPYLIQFDFGDSLTRLSGENMIGEAHSKVLMSMARRMDRHPNLVFHVRSYYSKASEDLSMSQSRINWLMYRLDRLGICEQRIQVEHHHLESRTHPAWTTASPHLLFFWDYSDLATTSSCIGSSYVSPSVQPVFPVFRYLANSRDYALSFCQSHLDKIHPTSVELELAIDSLAEVLLQHPTASLRITGHCATNEAPDLSWVRAADVAQLFINRGVSMEQLNIVGREGSDPIIPNWKLAQLSNPAAQSLGHAQNRRVTLLLALARAVH